VRRDVGSAIYHLVSPTSQHLLFLKLILPHDGASDSLMMSLFQPPTLFADMRRSAAHVNGGPVLK